MTSFYVCVRTQCGARGLYFERGRCVETAAELSAFSELEWTAIRQQLRRQRLAYQVFVSPRDARAVSTVATAEPSSDRGSPEGPADQLYREQRVMPWRR